MLLLSSADFLFQDSMVSYNLYVDQITGKYFFKPTIYANRNICPPSFWLYREGASWKFEGIPDKDLRDQAIEEISYYLDFRAMDAEY
jgi:hypothetical protein